MPTPERPRQGTGQRRGVSDPTSVKKNGSARVGGVAHASRVDVGVVRALARIAGDSRERTCKDLLLGVAAECAGVLREELSQHTACISRQHLPTARRSDCDCSAAKPRVKASLHSVGAVRP